MDTKLLQDYRDELISFVQMAEKMNISHQKLSYLFKKNNLKTNKQLKRKKIKHDYFNDINSFDKAYLLGYYISDGCITISKSGNNYYKRIQFSCTKDDVEILEFIKKSLNIDNKIYINNKSYKFKGTDYICKPMASLKFVSEEIFDLFENKEIGRLKSKLNYDLPNMEDDLFFKFLLGAFDGDGGISSSNVKKGKYEYTNTSVYLTSNSINFLESISNRLNELIGIKSNIIKEKGKAYTLKIYRKKDIIKLGEKMYENINFGLKRKKEKFKNILL